MSFSKLLGKIKEKNSPVVIGLDPRIEYIPEFIREKCASECDGLFEAAANAVFEFNKGIIDACHDLVPAVKPQSAFYEMLGVPGVAAFKKTIDYAKAAGLYVIADCKRNDIDSTAQGYASAYLGGVSLFGKELKSFDADALTVNAYLGTDGILPFVDACKRDDKGIFVLVKTSNKSSGELQDMELADGRKVYEHMASLVTAWGADNISADGYSAVGAVVGATYPEQLLQLRAAMPNAVLLIPGYGAQGGKAEDIKPVFKGDTYGAVVNSSRGIMCAYMKSGDPKNYAEHARNEVIRMNDELR